MSADEKKSNSRLGLLIPAVNTESEPQFNRYAPDDISIHVMRARIAGQPEKALGELKPVIESAIDILCDARPELIVFHCTGTSMKEGVRGDKGLLELIEKRSGVAACSTIALVVEAMKTLGMTKVTILSPYRSNKDAENYLAECRIGTAASVALALRSGADYPSISVQDWIDLALANNAADADGFFLSCTNTTQIEAVARIEALTGKPVVNSNQAVLWGAARRLSRQAAGAPLPAVLGRLGQL